MEKWLYELENILQLAVINFLETVKSLGSLSDNRQCEEPYLLIKCYVENNYT